MEEVYREWPSVWRRYGTEYALEVELGSFLVKTRAGLYAIYAKDWLFQPFVRDEESRDLLHEAAAFVAEKYRELAGRFGLGGRPGKGPARRPFGKGTTAGGPLSGGDVHPGAVRARGAGPAGEGRLGPRRGVAGWRRRRP